MIYLSLELLKKNLEKVEEPEFVTKTPEGFDEKFYMDFLRVMSLPDGDDAEDIPDETLMCMLEQGEELFKTLDLSPSVYRSIFSRLSGVTSNIPAMKRRVL